MSVLALPTGRDDLQKAMKEIGESDPGDMTAGQFKTELAALPLDMLTQADLNAVNYLAARLSSLTPKHTELLEAILESPSRPQAFCGIEQMIDFACNTGVYELYHGVHGPEESGAVLHQQIRLDPDAARMGGGH